jgi:ribosome biogenesis GTPase / thiamine phosphate phosphatase
VAFSVAANAMFSNAPAAAWPQARLRLRAAASMARPIPMIETLDIPRLRRIGLSMAQLQQLSDGLHADSSAQAMRVTEVQRDALHLHDGSNEWPARAWPAVLHDLAANNDALAVGDWVLARRDGHGQWWVTHRLPPITQLARRLNDGRDKVTRAVIVSNVDTALLVMGLDLDFNLRRLERYLALVRLAGVSAVVVLSKADLCSDVALRLQQVQAVLPPDTAALALNALDQTAVQQLSPWLREGSTLVLLGSSGAGKSSLTNSLLQREVQNTGANRAGDSRGRHTTTARSLHLTPQGACIIDTPGLRTLRLDGEAGDVEAVFADIAALAPACHFRDCRHVDEPGCAVRGVVSGERLRNFQKLLREAQRDTMTALQRKAQVGVWKQRGRAAKAVIKAKRG